MTTARKDPAAAAEASQDHAQEVIDNEEEQGFRGNKVDPTPNEHYTVAGVVAGKPTPETDPEHRAKVRAITEAGR